MTHDPAIWCRPPEGTKAGTVCWLCLEWPNGHRDWCAMMWLGDDVDAWQGILVHGANRVARAGWRFHSVATVPGEGE